MNKLEEIILKLKDLNLKHDSEEEMYRMQKKKYENEISKIFGKKNIKTHDFNYLNENIKATFVENKKIDFKIDMIEQVLDADLLEEITIKRYEINDYNGLVANPKIFKQFISCEKKINKDKLNQLSELGDITLDDLNGCYETHVTSSYVRLTTNKLEEPNEEDS